MTDVELVARAQAGDPHAAEAVVRRYRGLAFTIAREFFLPGGDTDDVRQEALIGVLQAARSFRIGGGLEFGPFAAMCVRRHLIVCLRAARRRKHQPLNEAVTVTADDAGDPVDALDTVADLHADPADVLARRERVRAAVSVVARLSPMERRALVGLANGISYTDIASGTASTKWVDNAAQRARRKLEQADAA